MDFLQNLYLNLKDIGLHKHLKVHCLDEKCYKACSVFMKGIKGVSLVEQPVKPKYRLLEYGKDSYARFMEYKLEAVEEELRNCDYLLYADADVFFAQNPIDDLIDRLGDSEIAFMRDWNGDACAGFFFARGGWLSSMVFKPSPVGKYKDFDQSLINQRLSWARDGWKMLDVSKYCNGPVWRGAVSDWHDAGTMVVHYNGMEPKDKISIMRSKGHWLF